MPFTDTIMSTGGSVLRLCRNDSRTTRLTLDRSVAFFTTLFGIASPNLGWPLLLTRACQANGPERPRQASW